MVHVKRKKGDSFESAYREFKRRVQQYGVIPETKSREYRQPSKSRTARKRSALVSLSLRKKNDYLRKIGKLEDNPRNRGRRRR